jgi:hypothetical protein
MVLDVIKWPVAARVQWDITARLASLVRENEGPYGNGKWIVCSLGCRPFTYGFYCSESCNCSTETSNGCDSKTGKCRCKSGFHGERCEKSKQQQNLSELRTECYVYVQACSSSFWGEDCANKCDCNGSPCDSQTGECVCSPGRTGTRCEQGTLKRNLTHQSLLIDRYCRLSCEHLRRGLQTMLVPIVRVVQRGNRRMSMSSRLEGWCLPVSIHSQWTWYVQQLEEAAQFERRFYAYFLFRCAAKRRHVQERRLISTWPPFDRVYFFTFNLYNFELWMCL